MSGKLLHENGDSSTMMSRPLRRENPHKYLLYKPTFSQVVMFLSSGMISVFDNFFSLQEDTIVRALYLSMELTLNSLQVSKSYQ